MFWKALKKSIGRKILAQRVGKREMLVSQGLSQKNELLSKLSWEEELASLGE